MDVRFVCRMLLLWQPYGNFVIMSGAPTEIKFTTLDFIMSGVKIWGSLIGSPKDFEAMVYSTKFRVSGFAL